MRTLDELNELEINIFVNGEIHHQEEDTDYNSGTGLKEGLIADVYGLTIEISGTEYNIAANALSPQLVRAIEDLCNNELNNF